MLILSRLRGLISGHSHSEVSGEGVADLTMLEEWTGPDQWIVAILTKEHRGAMDS